MLSFKRQNKLEIAVIRYTLILIILNFSLLIAGGNSTYEFLRLDVSPRASALGGNFIAMVDDPTLLFYNPAGLSTLKNSYASVGFFKHLIDINLGYGVYTLNLKNLGNIGIGFIYINYGNFNQTDRYGNQLGSFSAGEIAIIGGFSREYERLKYGISSKLIYSSIAGARSIAVAIDIGGMYVIEEKNLNISLTLNNIGTQLNSYISLKENLPFEVKFAISKKLEHLPLLLNIGLSKINEPTQKIQDKFKNFTIGGEFNISENIDFRFGYNNERRREMKITPALDLTGFSFGIGLKIQNYRFDYSLISLGKIASLHQIGLTIKI